MLSTQAIIDEQEPNTLVIEDPTLYHGFVQLPKLVLYARNLSRDAKLLYAILLGYAWQEQRCFPGYQRLCNDMDASENMVRKCMRELGAAHLLSQQRRGQGRTNIYILHDLRTAKIAVQEHHKIVVVEPQESEDNEEAVKKQTKKEQSGVRNSKGSRTQTEEPVNEALFAYAAVFSTAKDNALESSGERKTDTYSVVEDSSAASSNGTNGKAKGRRKKGKAQAHQLSGKNEKIPGWLPGYIVDFSREFHDEEATASNITRAAHLFDRVDIDAEEFIEQMYEARRITKGRANIQKRSEKGKNPAWPDGFPNRMPYFFSVLEDLLGLKQE
jgi:hypothetical protein